MLSLYGLDTRHHTCIVASMLCSFRDIFKASVVIIIHSLSTFELQDRDVPRGGGRSPLGTPLDVPKREPDVPPWAFQEALGWNQGPWHSVTCDMRMFLTASHTTTKVNVLCCL